ncbi:hypothetical protein K439DRAFT_1614186 [Ramaria rubella]|nr:hypothetical protein K439DRAFT_1614186 [Ramaria rubella]
MAPQNKRKHTGPPPPAHKSHCPIVISDLEDENEGSKGSSTEAGDVDTVADKNDLETSPADAPSQEAKDLKPFFEHGDEQEADTRTYCIPCRVKYKLNPIKNHKLKWDFSMFSSTSSLRVHLDKCHTVAYAKSCEELSLLNQLPSFKALQSATRSMQTTLDSIAQVGVCPPSKFSSLMFEPEVESDVDPLAWFSGEIEGELGLVLEVLAEDNDL